MCNRELELNKQYIEIWSKVVDTQMHFNEMCVKSRQLGLAFIAAALGLGIVLLTRGNDFTLLIGGTLKVHVVVLLLLSSVLALYAVRLLDLNVYHKMLRGAVQFNEEFEEKYMKGIFPDLPMGMSQSISHFSRFEDASVDKTGGKVAYTGTEKVVAAKKIGAFYRVTIWSLLVTAAVIFWVNNWGGGIATDESGKRSSEAVLSTSPQSSTTTVPLDVVLQEIPRAVQTVSEEVPRQARER